MVDQLRDQLAEESHKLALGGRPVATLALDLRASDAPARILSAVNDAFGKVDILVNNAGVGISGTLEEFTDEQWDRTLAINLTAPFRIARQLVPTMAKRGYGRVINISSMNGSIGMRGDTAYAASKAGLEALTRSIAVDYGRFGVTANAIAPGTIVTPLNRDILGSLDPKSAMVQIVVTNKPIPGDGEVDDIATAVAFLASEEAKFISGQVLAVDGGLTETRFVPDPAGQVSGRYLPKN
jgi:NAD(P)-dependent dehydrogenase (short-subunit alcohol dehydrogenase family)